jgi:hypothetical protein
VLRLWEVRDGWRKALRRVVEPQPGTTRRLPAGPYRGITVETDPASSTEVAYSGDMWFGLWESELAPHFRRLCRPGMRCVEVGSLHAVYAMMFAKLCQAPVISYEPEPVARARCERNLALNPELARWVEIRPVGVGNGLDAVTLDEDLASEQVDLVLIDVFPGGEVDVLTGATRLLAVQRPHLIVECHSREWERACGDLLVGAGYRPLVVTRRRLLPQNIAPLTYASWLVA